MLRVQPSPDREPRRGRRARHPRAPRARDRGRRRLLDRRRGRAPHAARRPRRLHRPAAGRPRATCKIPSIIAAATTTRCEAVHPGWGFLAENPAFAEACAENDLVFVGPTAETMTRMGDKAAAKQEMAAAGVPVVPGTLAATTLEEARAAADEVGYPVLLKAVGGRRGKGHAPRSRARRARGRVPDRRGRGAGRVRRPGALHREGDRPGAARRDPGARGRAGRRPHPRRARVLDPAPAPEADRGVAVARRSTPRRASRDGGRGRAGRARGRATGTPGRSSSCSAPTGRSTSSS